MSKQKGELVSVKIIPNDKGAPAGKLADAFQGKIVRAKRIRGRPAALRTVSTRE